MIRIFSVGIRGIPHLETFLDSPVGSGLATDNSSSVVAVAGWGLKTSAKRAIRYASKLKLPYFALEDGFLRSVGVGHDDPPLSIVIDDVGIYYDANRPSRLESLIRKQLSPAQERRANFLVKLGRNGRVSKYNHLRECSFIPSTTPSYAGTTSLFEADDEAQTNRRYVLVVDQTVGDASIKYGQATSANFRRMLQAALEDNPDCMIVIKIHPDVCAGKKRGHFDLAELSLNPRIAVITEDVHPTGLIEKAEAVYVVTSQMGFEGLIWGKRVYTFGMPFYAGWGLTEDALSAPDRRGQATLEQLVHAALVEYPRYVNPETGRVAEVEEILDYLTLQRRMQERFPVHVQAVNFPAYKRASVRRFFCGSMVNFTRHLYEASNGPAVAVWGCNASFSTADDNPSGMSGEIPEVIRLEDGFLRSVGLGADLVRPLSWVMDRRGIYYDATRPSELEHLLQTNKFDSLLLTRARRLRVRIVAEGLSKYNVGRGKWYKPIAESDYDRGKPVVSHRKQVILVPGQVETDASIRFGGSSIRTNIGLLQAVREANPDAYIVYKPHPDIVNGLRSRGKGENEASCWCDEIVKDVSVHELMKQVDEVHVLTSLTGFEALLRGKPVTTYGQPFYAGWGLTRDLALTSEVMKRRTRRLSLDELVAGVLILYPTYVSRTTGHFTTPERAVDELVYWRDIAAKGTNLWRWPLHLFLQAWGRIRQ